MANLAGVKPTAVLTSVVVAASIAWGAPSAQARQERACPPPWPSVEAQTLHVDFVARSASYPRRSRVLVDATVTRLGPKGSAEATAGTALPPQGAVVEAELLAAGKRVTIAAQDTDRQGRAILAFHLPPRTPLGPVDISGTVRYVAVAGLDCTSPVVVEHGTGGRKALFRVRG